MCLRMNLCNENVLGDKTSFELLGFVVCGLLVWFFNSPEKINGYMLIKHIQTPNYKMSNALIILIWAFRLFLDQPQQYSHGSKTTAEPTGTEVNEKSEQSLSGTTFASRYLTFTLTSTYLRCASNISVLTVSTVGISDIHTGGYFPAMTLSHPY